MKRIQKDQEKRVEDLVTRLKAAHTELEQAVEDYNAATLKAYEDFLKPKAEAWNELADESKSLTEEIHESLEQFHADRSEKWQESEAGEKFQGWIDSWDNLPLDEVQFNEPDEVEFNEEDLGELLEALPRSVEDVS